jgi:hypothetical protein
MVPGNGARIRRRGACRASRPGGNGAAMRSGKRPATLWIRNQDRFDLPGQVDRIGLFAALKSAPEVAATACREASQMVRSGPLGLLRRQCPCRRSGRSARDRLRRGSRSGFGGVLADLGAISSHRHAALRQRTPRPRTCPPVGSRPGRPPRPPTGDSLPSLRAKPAAPVDGRHLISNRAAICRKSPLLASVDSPWNG